MPVGIRSLCKAMPCAAFGGRYYGLHPKGTSSLRSGRHDQCAPQEYFVGALRLGRTLVSQ